MLAALALAAGLASAFVPPASMAPARVVTVSPTADVSMMAAKPSKKVSRKVGAASPTKPKVTLKAKPLSPGSNYPTTKNIQTQSTGFGSFLQKFQLAKGKSKYGMPIFLANGNINPAYLAAERKAMAVQSKKNVAAAAGKTKKMKAAKTFELGDWIAKTVGIATDSVEYYKSGK